MVRSPVPAGLPKVWILIGDLSRTGVPILLARYLGSGPVDPAGSVRVVARFDGPVRADLEALGVEVTTLDRPDRRSVVGAASVGLRSAGFEGSGRRVRASGWRWILRHGERPDVVLVHGAGGVELLDALDGSAPLVVHLHELAVGLARSADRERLGAVLDEAVTVMAVSEPVRDLAVRFGADRRRTVLLPGVVDPRVSSRGPRPQRAFTGSGQFVVGGVGTVGWRKGTDRLAAIAYGLRSPTRRVSVRWVGGRPSGPDIEWVEADDPVRWFDERPDPWSVLSDVDVVVIPSREDALPLVALEAAQRGLPVVATATGGLPDLLADGRGWVVGTHDVPGLISAVGTVLEDRDAAAVAAAGLRDHVERHHGAAPVAARWWNELTAAAGGGSSEPPG